MNKDNGLLSKTITIEQNVISPNHHYVQNWIFQQDEEKEALLADAAAAVAEKNDMSINEFLCTFPTILRILKSKSIWASNK